MGAFFLSVASSDPSSGSFRNLACDDDNPQERIEYPQHKPSDYPQEKDKYPQHKLRSHSGVWNSKKTMISKLRLVRELVEINLKYQTRLLKS